MCILDKNGKKCQFSPSDITKDNPVKILKAAFGISLSNIVSTACNNPSKCFESSRRQDVQSRFNDSDETNWKSFLQLFSVQMFKFQRTWSQEGASDIEYQYFEQIPMFSPLRRY